MSSGTTTRTITTTTTQSLQETEDEEPRTKETDESVINRRYIRAAERSSQPTRRTPPTTSETLLSDILKGITTPESVSTTTSRHRLQETRKTVTPEWLTTTPGAQHVDIKKNLKESTQIYEETTTPVTEPIELHKILKAEGVEITTHKSTITPVTFVVKEGRPTESVNQKLSLEDTYSTTPSVERTTPKKPAVLREAATATPYTTEFPRVERTRPGKIISTLPYETQ